MRKKTIYEWNKIYLRRAKFWHRLARICLELNYLKGTEYFGNKAQYYIEVVKENLLHY